MFADSRRASWVKVEFQGHLLKVEVTRACHAGVCLRLNAILAIVVAIVTVIVIVSWQSEYVVLCTDEVEEVPVRTGWCEECFVNGGTCDQYTGICQCPTGYEGAQCEQVRVTSQRDPCESHRCLHGAKCFEEIDNGRPVARCRCTDDWTGKHCQVFMRLYTYLRVSK